MKTHKKLLLLIYLIFFTTFTFASTIPHYQMSTYDQQFTTLLKEISADKNINSRIEKISAHFLGEPYLAYPLGEGKHGDFDQAPLYRGDGFDCQTLVETVLALASSQDLMQFKKNILNIRYQDTKEIKFLNRNHFVELDWNQNNIEKRYIKNVTHDLGVETQTAETLIDKPEWIKHLSVQRIQLFESSNEANLLAQLHKQAKFVHSEQAKLDYIPLTELFHMQNDELKINKQFFTRIPSGAIIEIVRPHWHLKDSIGTDMLISHLGFAIHTSQGLMFRHASSEKHEVIDVSLIDYLAHYYQLEEKTTLKGISVSVAV